MLFLEVVIKRKSNSWDVRTFTIDCLKCHQVHTRSPQRKTMQNTVLGTAVWHEIFAGSNFCDFCRFSSDPQKYVPVNKNYHKHFSRKNLLQSKYSLTWIRYTKIYYSEIVPFQSQLVKKKRNTGLLFENQCILLHVLNKRENIIYAGYWVLSENGKN